VAVQNKPSWTTPIAPSAAQPVKPGLFSGTPRENPNRASEVMQFNAPRFTLGLFRPLSGAPENPLGILGRIPERADKPSSRCLNRPSEWSFRNPFGMTGGDPKHTRAERVEN
jgi:hypothetical protein